MYIYLNKNLSNFMCCNDNQDNNNKECSKCNGCCGYNKCDECKKCDDCCECEEEESDEELFRDKVQFIVWLIKDSCMTLLLLLLHT